MLARFDPLWILRVNTTAVKSLSTWGPFTTLQRPRFASSNLANSGCDGPTSDIKVAASLSLARVTEPEQKMHLLFYPLPLQDARELSLRLLKEPPFPFTSVYDGLNYFQQYMPTWFPWMFPLTILMAQRETSKTRIAQNTAAVENLISFLAQVAAILFTSSSKPSGVVPAPLQEVAANRRTLESSQMRSTRVGTHRGFLQLTYAVQHVLKGLPASVSRHEFEKNRPKQETASISHANPAANTVLAVKRNSASTFYEILSGFACIGRLTHLTYVSRNVTDTACDKLRQALRKRDHVITPHQYATILRAFSSLGLRPAETQDIYVNGYKALRHCFNEATAFELRMVAYAYAGRISETIIACHTYAEAKTHQDVFSDIRSRLEALADKNEFTDGDFHGTLLFLDAFAQTSSKLELYICREWMKRTGVGVRRSPEAYYHGWLTALALATTLGQRLEILTKTLQNTLKTITWRGSVTALVSFGLKTLTNEQLSTLLILVAEAHPRNDPPSALVPDLAKSLVLEVLSRKPCPHLAGFAAYAICSTNCTCMAHSLPGFLKMWNKASMDMSPKGFWRQIIFSTFASATRDFNMGARLPPELTHVNYNGSITFIGSKENRKYIEHPPCLSPHFNADKDTVKQQRFTVELQSLVQELPTDDQNESPAQSSNTVNSSCARGSKDIFYPKALVGPYVIDFVNFARKLALDAVLEKKNTGLLIRKRHLESLGYRYICLRPRDLWPQKENVIDEGIFSTLLHYAIDRSYPLYRCLFIGNTPVAFSDLIRIHKIIMSSAKSGLTDFRTSMLHQTLDVLLTGPGCRIDHCQEICHFKGIRLSRTTLTDPTNERNFF